ncbi:TetR/AcrR family transcriptional regulator [Variovorax sp. YR216]|uniref:TetR/AcrR family transcriptional regulator n=1 Tax=Variovorax sp. YR216 TaxID=1882828 RepID=UPI00089D9D92|nr:TetR/AcrR family transcriptional regulator [Variovorax sp. YR216]SEA19912.1 transcriptional regulator, TetR family [Variovorax sp. YR216]
MSDTETVGRPNQRRRTRKDLLQAAARLMKQGRKPSLEEIAEEAAVSRATAYRYFPNVDALHHEASLDVAVPEPSDVLRDAPAHDPVQRLERVDGALHGMIRANEAALRLLLARSVESAVRGEPDGLPARQNRRTPLIEAALEPARDQFKPAAFRNLSRALALVIGTEAMVVFKDVLQLDDAEAQKVRRWAIRALVEAAKKSG